MRPIIFVALVCMSLSIYAAQPDAPAKADAPQTSLGDSIDEPQVTITKHSEQTVEEYRVGGRLYMIKITPKSGPPYYLVDDLGDGKFARQNSLDSGLRVPRWVLKRF